MSRIPPPSSSRSSARPPTTPTKSRVTPRLRTQSAVRASATTPTPTPTKAKAKSAVDPEQEAPSTPSSLSLKDAIAQRRAAKKDLESRKNKVSSGAHENFITLEDEIPTTLASESKQEEEDVLGRLPIREAIERARSTGSLNIATRGLPCIPSALFEIHLGVEPARLSLVPDEPHLPPPTEPESTAGRRGKRDTPAWFEAQDLQVLKAWNNEIVEIQSEISLFGSLKTVDLHHNKLAALPTTFADLTALTILDLSHNALTTLPKNFFSLPELTTLNISHNQLTAIQFKAPFTSQDGSKLRQNPSTNFFAPAIVRASQPLPKLINFDASNNRIMAEDIDLPFPSSVVKINLSENPLGTCNKLLTSIAALPRLKEAHFEKAIISDDSLIETSSPFSNTSFPNIQVLNFGETAVTHEAVTRAFGQVKKELLFDFGTSDLPMGTIRVMVGKRIMKEQWEIELERRSEKVKGRSIARADEEETGIIFSDTQPHMLVARKVEKEQWEIDAEQGLLTEGGKRRARAAAAAAATAQPTAKKAAENLGMGAPPPRNDSPSAPTPSPPPSSSVHSLASPQYYSESTRTLTLPPSAAPSKMPNHARSFSLAASHSSSSAFSSNASTSATASHLAVPAPTLPLSVIVTQPFADTLRVLVLANRRMDRSFALPAVSGCVGSMGLLPHLEELDLGGCNLVDNVPVVTVPFPSPSSSPSPSMSSSSSAPQPILQLIAKLFPSLRTLNLSYNQLTSAALMNDVLAPLVTSSLREDSEHRLGLKHLRLQGNRIDNMDSFVGFAAAFAALDGKAVRNGNVNAEAVKSWTLEELDVRDNEIGKVPPEMGYLPLEVFLVDGNVFRVPQRRVWERDGTRGLINWLKARVE